MPLQPFDFEAIARMDDGRLSVAMKRAIERAIVDLNDRPLVKKARTITLTVALTPQSEDGDLDSVDVTFAIGEAHPKRESTRYNMVPHGDSLMFNEREPEDPKTRTIEDALDEHEAAVAAENARRNGPRPSRAAEGGR